MSRLTNQRALITGASGGIGRALAVRLAEAGVDVVLMARRESPLAETAAAVEAAGRRAVIVVGDVGSSEDRCTAIDTANEQLGGLDLLINNAGISAHGRFHESGPDRLRQIMEVNFFAAAELLREATPLLMQGVRPTIVNIGSILGWRGVPHNAEYCASKFALRGLSEAIRPELARLGIHVLHVSPGTVDTDFFEHLVDKQGDLPWGTRQGVPAAYVAERTVRAIERRRKEVTIGWQAWCFVRASRFALWLMDRVMGRYG